MYQKLAHSSKNISIKGISFRLLSADQISKVSVTGIENKTLYDINSRSPLSGGPLDLRLGVSTKVGICSTCNESIQSCSGHFGHIKLFLPVYHIGFLKNTIEILNCICKCCGSLLINLNRKLSHSEPINLALIKNECKNVKSCPKCKAANGTVKKNSGFRVYHEVKTSKGEVFTTEVNPQTCLNLFNLIETDDYVFLGLKENPSSLIIQNLLVPPSCIRPSVDMQEDGFNEDDLTVKLCEIINTNKLLEESVKKGNSLPIINDDWDYLQLQISLFINSDLPSVNIINTPIRGLVQRLKGKAGRFRCNLSGKRVDFTGRTVISPDPNLSVEQVGVPREIAKTLTIPEKVNSINKPFLTALVTNGVNKWPGANFVISKDDKGKDFKRFLMYGKTKELKIGDVVERHLMDDDIVLFNRQPSLHRMSIMAHKVKVHQHRTFRFNECDCSPYNADFDGDEMNIHVPQTYEARAEAAELMGIKNNICTARNGEPLISCTQDFVTGAFLLTGKNVFFTRDRFAQLCTYIADGMPARINSSPVVISPVELFTGKQLFEVAISYALSKFSSKAVINLFAKNRGYKNPYDINDGLVQIINSRFIMGRLDKAIIGGENRKGSLIYQLLSISKSCAISFMNSIARLTSRFLSERGFSIGLDDVYPGPNLISSKNRIINDGYKQVDQFIKDNVNNLELEISSVLNKIREECGNVCIKELSHSNSPIVMQECGSKGSKINVSQMIACVGQQIISGHRIPNGMINRTLPHFAINSLTPESKGFVMNSFFTGLHGYEFFFHAVSGREGLVDTAVKTAETGYMQRRLMKALEDFSLKYDYTVRNSTEDLVQFRYGDDSVQTLKNEEEQFLDWIYTSSVSKFMLYDEKKNYDKIVPSYLPDCISRSSHNNLSYGSFNIAKFVSDCCNGSGFNNINPGTEKILEIIESLRNHAVAKEILNSKRISELVCFLERKRSDRYFFAGSFYFYFQNTKFLEIFFESLREKIMNMIIDPGTSVGAIAGQSIGEPGTQMTLKTFHFAGVASMNITLGVPRLKEIINATANISTPMITANLNTRGLEVAKVVKGRIERLSMKDITSKITTSIFPDKFVLTFYVDLDLIKQLRAEISINMIADTINSFVKMAQVEVDGDKIRYNLKKVRENTVFNVEKIRKQILMVKLSGLEGVNRVIINCKNTLNEEYELFVEGKGFDRVLSVPGIDPFSTITNDILETERVLGVEAARSLIIREVEFIMGKHGIKVDHRHILLLADTMAFKGRILGITRFGIGKMHSSTLMLASFEQTADYLFNAAVHGFDEKVKGVSESIILGIPISLGTGSFKLYWKK